MNLIDYLKNGACPKRRIIRVPVPGWGEFSGKVYVRTIDVEEFAKVQAAEDDSEDLVDKLLTTVVHCCCNEKGENYFTDDDKKQLRKEPLPVILRIAREAQKLNGIEDDEVEAIEKN